MTIKQAVDLRHSVRQYLDTPISSEHVSELNAEIDKIKQQSGLSIFLVTNEPKAFSNFLAKYGKFKNANNYIVISCKKSELSHQKVGYYGERLVLFAQTLNLNTCWVALTYDKTACPVTIPDGEKIIIVISIGYGATQGAQRKSKNLSELYKSDVTPPDWFLNGVECARKAPTAINQQQFLFIYENGNVIARKKPGPCSEIDLGIVKYHFEIGADMPNLFNL